MGATLVTKLKLYILIFWNLDLLVDQNIVYTESKTAKNLLFKILYEVFYQKWLKSDIIKALKAFISFFFSSELF